VRRRATDEEIVEPGFFQLGDPLEGLLASLVDCDELRLVVKNDAATAELRGRATLRTGPEWLTIEVDGGPDHVHVRRGSLASAEFSTAPGKNHSVRFFGPDGRGALACIVPGTNDGASDYSPDRRRAFEAIEAAHRGAPWRRDSTGTR
jgi:hypothetical protein